MNNSLIKHTLQRVAIGTQFPPFIWLYRALYALSIHMCVRRFRGIQGVRSVYLRRGLAAAQALYGLSDIDLLLVVDDENQQQIAARVHYQYELLRRMIPMLAEDELAVYSMEQLRTLYHYSSFYQHRFNRGRHEWKRLFGEDVFTILQEETEHPLFSATQELGPAWNYLLQEVLQSERRPQYLRKYVSHKWIAETARTTLMVQGSDVNLTREDAVHQISSAYPEIAGALKTIQEQRRNLLSSKPFSASHVLESYFYLARKAFMFKTTVSRFRKKLHIHSAFPMLQGLDLFKDIFTEIQTICTRLDGIEQAVCVPRLCFEPIAEIGMNPTDLAGVTVDAFDLVLIGKRQLSVEMLGDLNGSFARFRPTIEPYFADGELAVSLHAMRGWPIKDKNSTPEFFACLESARPIGGKLKIAESMKVNRPFHREDIFEQRAKSLLSLFKNGDAFRMSVLDFLALFWEAGRAAYLATQSKTSTIEIPVLSGQVIDALSNLNPTAENVLRRIHQEYLKALRKESSEAIRYMHWAGLYALKLYEMLFSPQSVCTQLPAKPETELTISVVIITRNQDVLLEQALISLVEQERRPDEVVVVDNASMDNTQSVVYSFADRLNVSLVREEKVGIPYARNAGIDHCSGDIIAFMDGDCRADRRWLSELEVPFLKDPNIGAVGGSTVPIERKSGLVARFYDTHMQDRKESN